MDNGIGLVNVNHLIDRKKLFKADITVPSGIYNHLTYHIQIAVDNKEVYYSINTDKPPYNTLTQAQLKTLVRALAYKSYNATTVMGSDMIHEIRVCLVPDTYVSADWEDINSSKTKGD